jgi:hypothetical protein
MDYINTYLDFLKYDPTFQNNFIGLVLQFLTLIFAGLALAQIRLMKEQNKYSVEKNKIDALESFQKLIREMIEFQNKVNAIQKMPEIELNNYSLKELDSRNLKDFETWKTFFETNTDLKRDSFDLANKLELFAVSIENKEILKSVKDMVSFSFCEMVETNPAVYILTRPEIGRSVYKRYEKTISLRKIFLSEVGSIKQREEYITKYIIEAKEGFDKVNK